MKSLILALPFALSFTIIGCSSSEQNSKPMPVEQENVMQEIKKKEYPKALEYVFKAHGGMELWNSMKTLSYDMIKSDYSEHQVVDLKTRKVRIEQEKFTIGFNGEEVWVQPKDTNSYNGDARFYHNLYFYFFAMPFVLGDDGIEYEETEPLKIDGYSYPGVKITYKDGVGDSSKDNYFLYYNPTTYQAEWLGYTVTYFDGKPSQEIHYLNFTDWKKMDGVLLPETLTWYNIDSKTGEKTSRGAMEFKNVTLSSEMKSDVFYENAKM